MIYFTYAKDHPAAVVSAFVRYLGRRGFSPDAAAVLARGHALVGKLRPTAPKAAEKNNVCPATAIQLWVGADQVQQIEEALLCMGRFMSGIFWPKQHTDSRHHYCPEEESSAMQWRLFLARVLNACTQDADLAELKQTWTVWAKNVRGKLPGVVAGHCAGDARDTPGGAWFRAPQGKGEEVVADSLEVRTHTPSPPILTTTIHQAKGETYDAVLLVSSPTRSGDGGHWSHWLDSSSGDGEHTRFAY